MYSERVTKAVVPAAGLGTRMRPLTVAVPKELLPVGNLPMMHYSILEAVAAGVDEIYVVVNKDRKLAIEDFYLKTEWRALIPFWEQEIQPRAEDCRLIFLDQKQPYGIVDAIEQAREFIGESPFFVLMPDNVFFGSLPAAVQLWRCFSEYGQEVVALIEVDKETGHLFGNSGRVKLKQIDEHVFSVLELMEKSAGSLQVAGSQKIIRTCGRYILNAQFFEIAQTFDREVLRQKDEIPILQQMIQNSSLMGVLLEGQIFDCGNWNGYWAANRKWMQVNQKWN